MRNERSGLIQAFSAYTMWGLFPLYWYFLAHLPASEIMANRIIWSFVLLVVLIAIQQQWKSVLHGLRQKKVLGILVVSSLLVSGNWLLYIWAVSNEHVIEASMGYYINPIVNILLGAIFLRERLRKYQYLAVLLAVIGVVYMTAKYGRMPYIALTLAVTFAFYALLRKIVNISGQAGLLIETGLVFLPATIFLMFQGEHNHVIFGSLSERVLLISGGLVTLMPLVFLANALKSLPLATIGFIQYLSPTLQIICGVLIFKEPFSQTQLISFAFIWLALIIYTSEAIIHSRRQGKATR